MKKRVTLKDIAARANLHISSVSMALRDHPQIPERTRQRVKAIAREMRYTPDPALSALVSYRTNQKRRTYQGQLAWIVFQDEQGRRQGAMSSLYFEHAAKRATELGYNLEEFNCTESPKSFRTLERQLDARNIRGVCFCSPGHDFSIGSSFGNFSIISLGFTLVDPEIHRVCFDYFKSIRRALDELESLGYRRIGFHFVAPKSFIVRELWESGIRSWKPRQRNGAKTILRFCQEELEDDFEKLTAWVEKNQLDVILGNRDRTHRAIETYNQNSARKITYVSTLGLATSGSAWIIDQKLPVIARCAMEQLVSMINRDERGVPSDPIEILVPGDLNKSPAQPVEPPER